jgi:exosortase H (IPTLxxWG-CTERM-specific)
MNVIRYDNRMLISFVRRHRPGIRSSAIFILYIVLAAFIYSRLLGTAFFVAFLSHTANAAAATLNLLGGQVSVSGAVISNGGFSVSIGSGCDGLVPIMLFICAVLVYPCKIKYKAAGTILGIVCLYLLNLLRIISLLYIGEHFREFFDMAHLLLWQSAMILTTVVLWLLWVRRTNHAQV